MKKILAALSMMILSFAMMAQSDNAQFTRDITNKTDNYYHNKTIALYENFYGISPNPSVVIHTPMFIDNDWIRIGFPSSKVIKKINKNIEKRSKDIRKREKKAIKNWEKQNKEVRKEREKRMEKIEKRDKKARKEWDKRNKEIIKNKKKQMKKIGIW